MAKVKLTVGVAFRADGSMLVVARGTRKLRRVLFDRSHVAQAAVQIAVLDLIRAAGLDNRCGYPITERAVTDAVGEAKQD